MKVLCKVLCVARDIAPSDAFGYLQGELREHSHEVTLLVASGKPPKFVPDDVRRAVGQADIVVVGMSSSAELAEPEIAACQAAMAAGKPFGFYGDTFRCHERARDGAWFGPFRHRASFFFAINAKEAEAARAIFPEANCVAVGNPLWEEFALPPQYTRHEIRRRLGASDEEKVILVPGGKSPVVNIGQWSLLADALAEITTENGEKYRVILSLHPGDRTPCALDSANQTALNIYGDVAKFGPCPFQFAPEGMKTPELLPGADVVVEFGSSVGVEAAHRRIPLISLSTELAQARHQSVTGNRDWELCRLGVSAEVGTAEELAQAIASLLADPSAQKTRQAEVFPTPPPIGTAVRAMREVLESLRR